MKIVFADRGWEDFTYWVECDGWLGDGITYGRPLDAIPESLQLSYSYDDSPRCIRVYEITP